MAEMKPTKQDIKNIMEMSGVDEPTANQIWYHQHGYDASDIIEIGMDGKPIGKRPPEDDIESVLFTG